MLQGVEENEKEDEVLHIISFPVLPGCAGVGVAKQDPFPSRNAKRSPSRSGSLPSITDDNCMMHIAHPRVPQSRVLHRRLWVQSDSSFLRWLLERATLLMDSEENHHFTRI
jgi:hypothetical protein